MQEEGDYIGQVYRGGGVESWGHLRILPTAKRVGQKAVAYLIRYEGYCKQKGRKSTQQPDMVGALNWDLGIWKVQPNNVSEKKSTLETKNSFNM